MFKIRLRNPLFAAFWLLVACGDPQVDPPTVEITDDAGTSIDQGQSSDAQDWSSVSAEEAASLQSQLDTAIGDLNVPGAAMAVAHLDEGQLWIGTSGHTDPDRTDDWGVGRQFRIGSVTKTFTTAAILMLVADGTVGLDDPVDDWVPGYFDRSVRIRHLATNTSGIASYNYVGSFDESARWTPTELVEWALTYEPELLFEPGTRWDYSNTNFVLLGMVIEAASGERYADFVASRLLEPLGLNDTYVAGANDVNDRVVPSFAQDGTDMTLAADPSFGFSAGAIVSTPADLARWAAALYGGDVLPRDMLDLMTNVAIVNDDGVGYGFGTFIEGEGDETLIGHTGGFAGYLTYMYYLPSESSVVVAMTNIHRTDVQLMAVYGWSVVLGVPFP